MANDAPPYFMIIAFIMTVTFSVGAVVYFTAWRPKIRHRKRIRHEKIDLFRADD